MDSLHPDYPRRHKRARVPQHHQAAAATSSASNPTLSSPPPRLDLFHPSIIQSFIPSIKYLRQTLSRVHCSQRSKSNTLSTFERSVNTSIRIPNMQHLPQPIQSAIQAKISAIQTAATAEFLAALDLIIPQPPLPDFKPIISEFANTVISDFNSIVLRSNCAAISLLLCPPPPDSDIDTFLHLELTSFAESTLTWIQLSDTYSRASTVANDISTSRTNAIRSSNISAAQSIADSDEITANLQTVEATQLIRQLVRHELSNNPSPASRSSSRHHQPERSNVRHHHARRHSLQSRRQQRSPVRRPSRSHSSTASHRRRSSSPRRSHSNLTSNTRRPFPYRASPQRQRAGTTTRRQHPHHRHQSPSHSHRRHSHPGPPIRLGLRNRTSPSPQPSRRYINLSVANNGRQRGNSFDPPRRR
jgi:hypothetical protein